MHEYSIAYDLYATARTAAVEHHATKVNKIFVDIGTMAMVNPEQVSFLFDSIKEEDPLFTDAVLECTAVVPVTRCSCGYEGDEIFICPRCGGLPDLLKGREIVVTSVAIEVDEA